MNKEDRRTLDFSGSTGMPLETLNWHGTALEREPPSSIEFRKPGEWVMRITADRRIEVNEGITVTEAAQHVLDALQTLMQPKPWVSLTSEEILDLFDVNNVYGSKWVEFARAVETKLKKKNT